MAKNERKHQQKIAKKQRRAKEIKKQRNVAQNTSMLDTLRSAASGKWVGCYLSGAQGMFQVYAIRQHKHRLVASIFLVDSYCLGVKDAFGVRELDMEAIRERIESPDSRMVSPSYALKFILGAIEYAHTIGFTSHSSTSTCLKIFGDTDPSECQEEFIYGSDGKPLYTSGPYDSPEKQMFVLNTLHELGEGNYHVMLGLDSHIRFAMKGFVPMEDEDDDDDYEDEFEVEDDVVEGEVVRSEDVTVSK